MDSSATFVTRTANCGQVKTKLENRKRKLGEIILWLIHGGVAIWLYSCGVEAGRNGAISLVADASSDDEAFPCTAYMSLPGIRQ